MRRLRTRPAARAERESTIPLINVVFLLLVFFIVAGRLSAPRDAAVELASARAFDPATLDPAMIYITAEGSLRVGGEPRATAAAALAAAASQARPHVTVVPDRRLEAARMLAILAALRAGTDKPLQILTRHPGAAPR